MKFWNSLCFLFLLAGTALASDWTHQVPAQVDGAKPLQLVFTRVGGEAIPASARLYLELDGQGGPALDASYKDAVSIEFSVPAQRLQGIRMEYWVELTIGDMVERLPEDGSYSVNLNPASGGGESFLLLSAGETTPGGEVLLAFSPQVDDLDLATLELRVDGRSLEGVVSDSWLVTWQGNLQPGTHTIELRVKDRTGRSLPTQRIAVETGSTAAAVALASRNWSAEAFEEFNMQRVDSRTSSWSRYHSGGFRAQGSYQDWRWRGRVLLSALDFESDVLQPQSRVEAEVSSKWLSVGLGDRQPQVGNLMLSGTRVRGVDLSLNSKYARLGFVTGATRQALDPVYDAVTSFAGSYQRDLTALDIGFGDLNSVSGALSVMTVRDDVGSIDASAAGIRPVDNFVIGTRMKQSLFKGRLWMRQEAALSLYNSNITDGVVSAELMSDTLGIDLNPQDYENIIIINEYLSPMDIATNPFSSAALDAGLGFRVARNEFQLDFQRIGPSYISLGNAFLDNDRQRLRLTDRVRLMESQLYLDLGYALSNDNLEGQYDLGPGTTTSHELRLGAGYYPHGTDLKLNLSLANIAEDNEAHRDEDQLSTSLSQLELGVSKDLLALGLNHRASLSIQRQVKIDDIGQVDGAPGSLPLKRDLAFSTIQVNLGLNTEIDEHMKSRLSISTFSHEYDDDTLGERAWWTLRAGLEREWRPQVLSTGLRFSIQSLSDKRDIVNDTNVVTSSQKDDYSRIDLGGEVSWNPFPRFSLQSRLDFQFYGGERNNTDLSDKDLHFVLRMTQTL
ncbi:MAG: hypothetical protein H6678_09650 [Candidatus Delongbacteria bacterium]|nr:hypothetical protein [Candidatus Delongbacteria bacterium]